MLAIALNIPYPVVHFFATTPIYVIAAYTLFAVGWVPIFGVLVWGFTHIWIDYKQDLYEHHLKYVVLEVRVPQGTQQTPKGMENFFSNLMGTKSGLKWKEIFLQGKENARFSFEIISHGGKITFAICLQEKFRDIVEADIYAQYPEAQITEIPDYAQSIETKYPNEREDLFGAEYTLAEPEYFPLRTYDDFEHQGEKDNRFKDPLYSVIEFFGKLQPHEKMYLQIIIKPPEDKSWLKAGVAFLEKIMGKPPAHHPPGFFSKLGGAVTLLPKEVIKQISGLDLGGGSEKAEKKQDDFRMFKLSAIEKAQMEGVAEKIGKVAWYTKIRYIALAPNGQLRKGIMAAGMKGIFQPFANPIMNSLGMFGPTVTQNDYFWHAWLLPGRQRRLAKTFKGRRISSGATPFILNAEELASLWHFPVADARTPVLAGLGARRSEAPAGLPEAPIVKNEPSLEDWKRIYMERRTARPHTEQPVPQHAFDDHGDASNNHDGHNDIPPNLPM